MPPPDDPKTAEDPPSVDMNSFLRDAVARRRTPVPSRLFADRTKTADDDAPDPPPAA